MIYLLDIINLCAAEQNAVIGFLSITFSRKPLNHPDGIVLEIALRYYCYYW